VRIAIVLNTSWNIHNFRMSLIHTLQAQGHEIHTIAPVDSYTIHLLENGCIHHPLRMDSRGANPIKDSALIFELYSHYKKIRPDIILHYTIKPNVYGTLAAALLGIPAVNNVCGLGTVFLKRGIISTVAKFLYRISFRHARKVFFQNPDDLNLFMEEKLVPEGITALIPGSGIDLNKFTPIPSQQNRKFTFLLISRLISDKGIFEFIEAVEKLKQEGIQASFQVLGAIDEEHKRGIKASIIQQWIDAGTIDYLGTTEDVRPYIHAADCVVLPSYREGTPRVLLEAASSARPIIATNVPGCKHVVEDQVNGLLCRLKDADDLAEKMRTMLTYTPEMRNTMGMKGREKVSAQFDESLVIKKYLNTLDEIESELLVHENH
jgi:glycosyltransferase involved in cell wall biosynthesis